MVSSGCYGLGLWPISDSGWRAPKTEDSFAALGTSPFQKARDWQPRHAQLEGLLWPLMTPPQYSLSAKANPHTYLGLWFMVPHCDSGWRNGTRYTRNIRVCLTGGMSQIPYT